MMRRVKAVVLTTSYPRFPGDAAGRFVADGVERTRAAGVDVEVVSPDPQVGVDTYKTQDAPTLHPKLLGRGVRLTPNRVLEAITPEGVELTDSWNIEHEVRAADSVVLATLRTPETALYEELRAVLPDGRRVGDALAPRRLEAILYEAEKLARAL